MSVESESLDEGVKKTATDPVGAGVDKTPKSHRRSRERERESAFDAR